MPARISCQGQAGARTRGKHPRDHLQWQDDSRDRPNVSLGPDSIDINKARFGHLVGGLAGAIARSRDYKFMTDSAAGVQRAPAAARMTIDR